MVEDSEIIRHIIVLKLQDIFESEIDEARDGLTALEMVKNKNYDVVVSDNHMPGLNGCEFVKAGQDYLKQTFKVMCTGLDVKTDGMKELNEAFDSGFDVFMPKPFDPLNSNFYDYIKKRFNPKLSLENTEWVKNIHDVTDDLNPTTKSKFILELEYLEDLIKTMIENNLPTDDSLYRMFQKIKTLLSYYDDDMMDEALFFENLLKNNKRMDKNSFIRLEKFLTHIKELINSK